MELQLGINKLKVNKTQIENLFNELDGSKENEQLENPKIYRNMLKQELNR